MARLLVHLATGPENPTRAALAFLVARSALAAGHDVDVFVAGDAVSFLRQPTADAALGIGTGSVSEHIAALREAGVPIHASGMSSKARGLGATDVVDGLEVRFSPPEALVELAIAADRTLAY